MLISISDMGISLTYKCVSSKWIFRKCPDRYVKCKKCKHCIATMPAEDATKLLAHYKRGHVSPQIMPVEDSQR